MCFTHVTPATNSHLHALRGARLREVGRGFMWRATFYRYRNTSIKKLKSELYRQISIYASVWCLQRYPGGKASQGIYIIIIKSRRIRSVVHVPRDHLKDADVDVRIILKSIWEIKCGERAWTGFTCRRIGSNSVGMMGGVFHKNWVNSWPPRRLAASQEGICWTELVNLSLWSRDNSVP
jgi:hypothetical protein